MNAQDLDIFLLCTLGNFCGGTFKLELFITLVCDTSKEKQSQSTLTLVCCANLCLSSFAVQTSMSMHQKEVLKAQAQAVGVSTILRRCLSRYST